MLEDFRLKVFMAVVQERSFTKAAKVLGITQPSVSQNIADLEKTTGRKLFDRLKGTVVLTAEGEVFLIYVQKLLEACASVDDMFSKVSPAVVKIAASEEIYAYLVGPALESFSKVHPDVIFERCMFGEADLNITLKPSSAVSSDDSILRIRMSVFPTPKTGDFPATHEKTSYFDVVFQPSPAFSYTRLYRLIKEFIKK
jgi:DNA-binding transcriptional LysR family regulator